MPNWGPAHVEDCVGRYEQKRLLLEGKSGNVQMATPSEFPPAYDNAGFMDERGYSTPQTSVLS